MYFLVSMILASALNKPRDFRRPVCRVQTPPLQTGCFCLRTRESARPHVHFLRRRCRGDVEVEDIHRET